MVYRDIEELVDFIQVSPAVDDLADTDASADLADTAESRPISYSGEHPIVPDKPRLEKKEADAFTLAVLSARTLAKKIRVCLRFDVKATTDEVRSHIQACIDLSEPGSNYDDMLEAGIETAELGQSFRLNPRSNLKFAILAVNHLLEIAGNEIDIQQLTTYIEALQKNPNHTDSDSEDLVIAVMEDILSA